MTHEVPPDAPRAEVRRRLSLRALGVIGLLQVLLKLRGLVLVALLLRVRGPEQFGIWVQVILFVSLVSAVSAGGLHSALLRFLPGATAPRRLEVLWSALVGGAAGALACGALSVFAVRAGGAFLGIPLDLALGVGGLVAARGLGQFASNVYRADGRGGLFAGLDAIRNGGELVAVAGAIFAGAPLSSALWGLVALDCAQTVAIAAHLKSGLPFTRPRARVLGELLRFSLPTLPLSFGSFLLNYADRYVIGLLLGPAAVGVYSAAYAVASLPLFLTKPVFVLLLPAASKAWNTGDRDGAVRLVRDNVTVFTSLALPAVAGLTLLGGSALELIGGRSYAEWSPSLLCSVGLGSWAFGVLAFGLHGSQLLGDVAEAAVHYLVAAAVNVALNLVLLPRLGLVAGGLTTLLAYGLVTVALLWRLRGRLGSLFDASMCGRAALASALMGATLWPLPRTGLGWLLAQAVLGVGLYALFALALGVVRAEQVRSLLRRVMGRFAPR